MFPALFWPLFSCNITQLSPVFAKMKFSLTWQVWEGKSHSEGRRRILRPKVQTGCRPPLWTYLFQFGQDLTLNVDMILHLWVLGFDGFELWALHKFCTHSFSLVLQCTTTCSWMTHVIRAWRSKYVMQEKDKILRKGLVWLFVCLKIGQGKHILHHWVLHMRFAPLSFCIYEFCKSCTIEICMNSAISTNDCSTRELCMSQASPS